ncbi:TetR family transcriptional regulator [Gordonia sp. HNM0687]|uniref:TetR family transcriptional regulator n=1 Tax=Gordonia mangrovi TaxID=2665643 RepID=A0A6L7GUF9_9ACTN|nr:TetR/AcrR family transcriptional regulator [Gordonia mangrovi]MXP23576.1 TetR family transcriptional regulator [Gordonia mangrovi]UVF79644.1 TetR family transcriptional regulator [Gordonia mangrovi]
MAESKSRRGSERRTTFGETAVEIIATQGLHALTHRTVDETAGYPPGSINYYAPTRSRLLALALETVHAQLRAIALESFGPLMTPGPHCPDDVVECGTQFVESSRTQGRKTVTARHALLIEAQFHPDLADMIEAHRQELVQLSVVVGAPFRPEHPEEAANLVVALMDGLIQQLVLGKLDTVTRPMVKMAMSHICTIGSESSQWSTPTP